MYQERNKHSKLKCPFNYLVQKAKRNDGNCSLCYTIISWIIHMNIPNLYKTCTILWTELIECRKWHTFVDLCSEFLHEWHNVFDKKMEHFGQNCIVTMKLSEISLIANGLRSKRLEFIDWAITSQFELNLNFDSIAHW